MKNKIWFNIKNLRIKRLIKKLFNKNEGLFEIIAVINLHAYRLKLPDNWECHDVFNAHLLHDSVDDSLPEQTLSIFLSINNNDHDDLYEVIRINDFRSFGGELKYLIIWKDVQSKDWWIRFENCLMTSELLQEYHQNHFDKVSEDRWQAYYRIQKNNDQEYVNNKDLNNDIDD